MRSKVIIAEPVDFVKPENKNKTCNEIHQNLTFLSYKINRKESSYFH